MRLTRLGVLALSLSIAVLVACVPAPGMPEATSTATAVSVPATPVVQATSTTLVAAQITAAPTAEPRPTTPPTTTPPPTATASPIPTVVATPTRDSLASAALLEDAIVALYDRASPSVVLITTELALQSTPQGDFPRQGAGTGFFVNANGDILTNNHVVARAQRIQVTLADGTSAPARVVGRDSANDLAVLRATLPPTKVKPLPLGDSSKVRPGQFAIAIGNPFGLDNSVTLGIVSSNDRTRANGASRPIRKMIQTDAAVNPGNSGGPLLNLKGEVIGITTSIESPIRGSVGIGFAVPIDTAKANLPEMLAGVEVRHPWLGISGRALDPELARELGLTVNEGVYVVQMLPGSPADVAGLKAAAPANPRTSVPGKGGDVILAVDGRKTFAVDDIVDYLDTRRVGDEIKMTILRTGDTLTITAKLGVWPEPTD